MRIVLNTLSMLAVSIALWACSDEPSRDNASPGSLSGANSIRELVSPAGPGSGQAYMSATADGRAYLSWLEPQPEGAVALRFSQFADNRWAPATTIATGSNWFINWADIPKVSPISAELLVAHWLVGQPDQPYAYDIQYSLSTDGGISWTTAQLLNIDGAVAEHGFVSFFEWHSGIGAVWLDGGELAALTIDELFDATNTVGMTLQFALLDTAGQALQRGIVDDLVCDCCRTDAVTTSSGPVIVYRDRSVEEIRDVAIRSLVFSDSGSAGWSEPVFLGPDNWMIDGCPVNGPAIAVAGSDVAVAWFTAAQNTPRIQYASSADGGLSFRAAQTIAPQDALGQVDVAIGPGGAAFVSWWRRGVASEDGGRRGTELVVARITDEMIATPRVVARSAESLPIDVPQMVISGDELLFAWSTLGSEGSLFTAAMTVW